MTAPTRSSKPAARAYLLGHYPLERRAFALLLTEELGVEVALESDFTPTSVWAAVRKNPDLVIVVADRPTTGVLDVVEMIIQLCPDAPLLVISAASEAGQLELWSHCNLGGYLVKSGDAAELRLALDTVRAGRRYYSPPVADAFKHIGTANNGLAKLSRREAELLPLLARGMTLREAAEVMEVSYKTADSYRTNLLRKVGVHDRVQLTRYAIRKHIIEP